MRTVSMIAVAVVFITVFDLISPVAAEDGCVLVEQADYVSPDPSAPVAQPIELTEPDPSEPVPEVAQPIELTEPYPSNAAPEVACEECAAGNACGGCGKVDDILCSSCDMGLHYPYFPAMHGYYYFRPYHHSHIPRQQLFVESWGGDRRNPYSNQVFQLVYEQYKADKASGEHK